MTAFILALALMGQQCRYVNGQLVCTQPSASRVVSTAQSIDPSYAAVCVRIENDGRNSTGYGSGVILTPTGLVLTCKHIFRGGVGQLTVRRSDGRSRPATFVAVDPVHDLGAIAISSPGPIPKVRYASEQPSEAVIVGFPGKGLVATAKVGRYLETANVSYGVNSPHGVSGGPVFRNGTLDLVGVQWGADGRSSLVTSIMDVRRFLMQAEVASGFSEGSPNKST